MCQPALRFGAIHSQRVEIRAGGVDVRQGGGHDSLARRLLGACAAGDAGCCELAAEIENRCAVALVGGDGQVRFDAQWARQVVGEHGFCVFDACPDLVQWAQDGGLGIEAGSRREFGIAGAGGEHVALGE